jgi:hypothetical protein
MKNSECWKRLMENTGGPSVYKESGDREKYNPRYTAYAVSNGRTEEDQLNHDKEAFPGGCMTGFMAWIGEQWRLFGGSDGWKRRGISYLDWHRKFDEWLTEKYK